MKKLILIFLILATASCSQTKRDEALQQSLKKTWGGYFKENFNDTKSLDIFVVTNRVQKSSKFECGENSFGVNVANTTQYGMCKVSVPKNHDIGEIKLAQNNRQSSHDFFKNLEAKSLQQKDLIEVLKQSQYTPLVFVHGFNVPYSEAILRASQIAYDLKYQGPVILYTWPAGANGGFLEDKMMNVTYENNLINAKDSINSFKNFLTTLSENDIKINLIVHSMGHQVVLPTLKKLGENPKPKILVNELFLNAPDFDAKEFKTFSSVVQKVSKHVTLYCSYNDKAMLASKTFNKNDRLGACAAFDGIDTVNVGSIDDSTFGLGHGYYSSRAILSDVFQVLLGIGADQRLFVIKSEPNALEKYLLRR